jgi:hypothetical protein
VAVKASVERRAQIVGTLLITATAASVAGSALLGPVLGDVHYLGDIYTAQERVLWGVLIGLVAA